MMRHRFRWALLLAVLFAAFVPVLRAQGQHATDTVATATRGYLLRTVDGAPPMSDSAYTADTTAIVRGLWKVKGPGKIWLVVPLFAAIGAVDRDGGGYRDAYTQPGPQPQDRILAPDKRDHLYVGGVTALLLDDRTFAWRGAAWSCAAGWAFELGQMRPAGFPKAVQGDALGYGSARDAVMNCTGAVLFPAARALVRKVRS